jgi:hypothetical protein
MKRCRAVFGAWIHFAAGSPQSPAGMTPAQGSLDQKNPLVNPDLERKGNAP